MGRSQETSNKKEVRNNKEKKRKEKAQKKEARKNNNVNGNNLDEMLAYVDENGMITSTPPDPTKKIVIKSENIEIQTQKKDKNNPEDLIKKGVVSFFNTSKGYGFIKETDTQRNIFVHANGLTEPIKENNRVTFEIEKGAKGYVAKNVRIVR